MRTVWTITAKDLRQRFRDRSALLFAFVIPLGLAFLFDLMFGGLATGDLGPIQVAVVTEDEGELGRAFQDEVLPAAGPELDLQVEEYRDRDAARRAVVDGTADAAVIFPRGFSDAVEAGEGADLEVLQAADAGLGGDVVAAIADGFANRLTGTQIAVAAAVQAGAEGPQIADIADLASQVVAPVELTSAVAGSRQLDTSSYLAAAMAVFFLFFTVQFGVTSYLEERRDGTLQRLLSAPVRRSQVLAAKGLTSFLVGVVATVTLLIAARFALGARFGDPLGVAVLVVAAVLSATALIAVVAAVARTAEQAGVWQSILAIVLGMAGGSFFPVASAGGVLAAISRITPHAWFLDGLGTLAGGGDVVDVLPAAAAMLAFGAVATVIGLLLGRRRSAEV